MRKTAHGAPDARREQILEAAHRAFLANGFADTSIDAIAGAAKVSKQTLYALFRDKSALFTAVVEREMEDFRREVPDLVGDRRAPEDVLVDVARWLYDHQVRPENIAMMRTLVGAAARFPDLVEAYHRFRVKASLHWVAAYLRQLVERGVLEFDDPEAAANRFALLASDGPRSLMGLAPLTRAERDRLARITARLFLHGLARPGSAAARL